MSLFAYSRGHQAGTTSSNSVSSVPPWFRLRCWLGGRSGNKTTEAPRRIICFLLATLSINPSWGADLTKTWATKAEFERCTTDGNIEIGDDGAVRLRKTVLLQDEQGMTHYNNAQALSATTWAKKQFMVDDPACDKAELFAFYATGAKVTCNGQALKEGKPLPSTAWVVWEVPVKLLKRGLNEFIFSGAGSLLIEPSLAPNRSALSLDGGKSWDSDRMGAGGVENGEFVTRLRLAQYPMSGTITSEVVDLLGNHNALTFPAGTKGFQATAHGDRFPGLGALEVRSGATPSADPSWSAWKSVNPRARAFPETSRWAQWRAKLVADKDGRDTPQLNRVELTPLPAKEAGTSAVEILEITPVAIQRGSWPFAHQAPFHRAELLRKRFKLDDVVAKGKTEMEKLVLLREWCRHTAPKGWDAGATQWVPPWDALVILETNKAPLALCMCTHYSTLFVQCAVALGYNARHLILDHHCAAEVWSNQFRKWIVMDTGNSVDPTLNCHFEKDGAPLGAVEIHKLWKADRLKEIEAVYTPPRGRVRGDELGKKDQCGFVNYRRFGIPFRNNHMATPFPGEIEHGEADYYCDAYLWWDDHAVPSESPEYGKTTCRVADYNWTLNETAIYLQASDAKDTPTVILDSVTPNLDKFVVSVDGGKWEPQTSPFQWKLHAGENTIRVKSVNQFGVEGMESVARVSFKGAAP